MNVRAELRRILVRRLSTDELHNLAWDMGVDGEGMGKSELVRAILAHAERREALGEVVEWIRRERGDVGL